MNEDPQRLFETNDASPELRADLVRAREDAPARYDVAAGLAAFEATLGAPPAGPEIAAATTGSKTMTWIIVAVLGAATAGAVAWAVSRGESSGTGSVYGQAPGVEPQPQAVGEPEAEAGPGPGPGAGPGPGPGPSVATPTTTPTPTPTPTPTSTKPDTATKPDTKGLKGRVKGRGNVEPAPDRLAAEMKATEAAKAALASNPSRALSLASKAEREFPKGLFKQERQAIIVLALFDLGRHAEAERKARAYLARHSRGAFAAKIRARLADEKAEG